MSKDPTVKWSSAGKMLEKDPENKPTGQIKSGTTVSSIKIKEYDRSFTLKGYEDAEIAGVPTEANLAIALIKRFHDAMPAIAEQVLYTDDFSNMEFTEADIKDFKRWVTKLLLTSAAISIDKNVILKNLSQPGCEGLRLYLCLKPENDDMNSSHEHDILSLVMVGINSHGKDLCYDYSDEKRKEILDGIYTVEQRSLISEYDYPPPPKTRIKRAEAVNAYTLGNLCWPDKFRDLHL